MELSRCLRGFLVNLGVYGGGIFSGELEEDFLREEKTVVEWWFPVRIAAEKGCGDGEREKMVSIIS